ncbi:MAG: hypothetical protein OEY20_14405 [Gemmatimonadota bacterium]|nr:hypothetical protein [Gemmatimonadota bacterium]MDH5198430.1 hypothetical protein [Gemmatimonadota bacterium]
MNPALSQGVSLNPDEIVRTIEALSRRIEERFPGAGLGRLCAQLLEVARHARERAAWIARPLLALRMATWALVALILAGLVTTLVRFEMPPGGFDLGEFIQILEAGINDVVLIGVAVFFLITLETRIKRRRALNALHELRVIAHIIDMHQLTKDPDRVRVSLAGTESSPRWSRTPADLGRYLDYCSEMLSLTGKIAALYVQRFPDDVALAAVNEIEDLSTGLSRKIWQKLMILHGVGPDRLAS